MSRGDEQGAAPAPAWFAVEADAVLADLFDGEKPLVEIGWIDPEPGSELGEMHVRAPDGKGFGYTIFADQRGEELRYTLAERVPEYLPELTSTWARAFPVCPGHSHPAEPDWDEPTEQAWWRCPRDGRRLARIGSLRTQR